MAEPVALPRPQALGALPLPEGYLLIDDAEVCATLAAGRAVAQWPEAQRAVRLVHESRLTEAYEAFDPGTGAGRYNRFVLEPRGADLDAVRAGLPPDLAPMADLVAFAVGIAEEPPEPGAATGEVLALILSAHASRAMESGDRDRALTLVRRAVDAADAPPLRAVLLGAAGSMCSETEPAAAAGLLEDAVRLLDDTDLSLARGELHYQLASVLHTLAAQGARPLTDAVGHYHRALGEIDRDESPELWAAANLGLGTAYLTMPMVEASDQLRSGIAMQQLRAALEVFTRDTHPQEWAMAQLNLANALVYAPSAKQGDNLVEAVERYEEVLAVRDPQVDPLGCARLLANQGNALAHLGIFDHATAKLYDARALFEQHGQVDAVMAVREVLDEISRQTARAGATS